MEIPHVLLISKTRFQEKLEEHFGTRKKNSLVSALFVETLENILLMSPVPTNKHPFSKIIKKIA